MNRLMRGNSRARSRLIGQAVPLAIGVALAATSSLPVFAVTYQFINIVDDSGPFDSNQFGGAAINNSGQVAFKAVAEGVHGIHVGSGGSLTPIADTSGPFNDVGFGAAINDAGVVAFTATYDSGGTGVFTGSGGSTDTVIDGFEPSTVFYLPSINNSGAVAFTGTLDDLTTGVFVSGNPLITIADLGGVGMQDFSGFDLPVINNDGTVAFYAFSGGGAGGSGVYSGNGGTVTTVNFVAATAGFFETPSINDSGAVAYVQHLSGSQDTLFINTTPFITASGSGPFYGLRFPSINSAGDITFMGNVQQPTASWGIYTGPNPTTDKVIQPGDPLFGSTVTSLDLNLGRRLNDHGEIAFAYTLANGVGGIAVARPLLPGDYNQNGTVDAADYTVWRDTLGSTTNLAADGNANNAIDAGDYGVWQANFGATAGSSLSDASVPEPNIYLALLLLLTLIAIRSRPVGQRQP